MCKLLTSLIVFLAVCMSAGCARFLSCCPPTNKLLTRSEAESISGVGMKLAYEILDSKRSSCGYINGLTGDDLISVGLDLHRFEEGGGPSNEAAHREVIGKFGSNVETINGIGDSAFLTQADNGVLLYARKGTLGLQLRAQSVFAPNEARAKLLAVARLVMTRLE